MDLRAFGAGSEDFVSRQLDRLDSIRLELEHRELALDERQQEMRQSQEDLARQWHRLEELRHTTNDGARQVQQEARRLAKLRSDLSAAKSTLEHLPAQGDARAGRSHPVTPPDESTWHEERTTLQHELAEAKSQIARLAEAALELATARRELAKSRALLLRQGLRLAHAKGNQKGDPRQNLEKLLADRTRLLEELEEVKRQAAEFAGQEQRQAATERAQWLEELTRLREALEAQARLLAGHGRAELSPEEALFLPADDFNDSDSGLDQVIAQFEQIQKDLDEQPLDHSPRRRSLH